MSNSNWNNDAIQFPRLLSELVATHELDLEALAVSMDLTPGEVSALLERADQAWEAYKAGEQPTFVIDLNVFDDDGNVVDTAPAELTHAQLSDVVDHAAQLVLQIRGGGDTTSTLAELEEALVVSDVLAPA